MKREIENVFLGAFALFVVAGIVVTGEQRMREKAVRKVIMEEAAAAELKAKEARLKAKPLTARNPKPDQDRLEWSDTDHQVFELLNEDRPEAIKEAMDLIWEEIRQPEPWLIDMRRKLGATNIYAPVGPGLNLDVVKPAKQAKSSEQP